MDNDGKRTCFTYDNADQQTLLVQSNAGGTVLGSTGYRYDAAGNRTTRIELAARTSWSYDFQNQLLSEFRSGTNPYRQTYTFDPAGNRRVLNADGSRTPTSYDTANQVIKAQALAGRTTYVFDANGTQKVQTVPGGGRTTVTWNFENQPTQYHFPLVNERRMRTMQRIAASQRQPDHGRS